VYERASKKDSPSSEIAAWLDVLLKKYRGAIVLDDLHVAAGEPAIADLVSDLVERRATDSRWIIATRDPLALPIASWLAYGLCDMPIDETDLRLTANEAADAVAAMGTKIHSSEVNELLSLTEGWPTAFGFALRASARTTDAARALAGTKEMVYTYLAEQVFRSLRQEERDFLLSTALLPSVDLEVLERAGIRDTSALLARLRRATSFIAKDSDTNYHYHDLFRDFLDQQLRSYGSDFYRESQISAARILRAAGRDAEALALFTQAKDSQSVSLLLRNHGVELFEKGYTDALTEAIRSLPTNDSATDPRLLLLSALLHAFRGRFNEADSCFSGALELAAHDVDLQADIAQRHALSFLNRVNVPSAIDIIARVDVVLIRDKTIECRVLATKASALSFAGRHGEAKESITRAVDLTARLHDESLRVFVLQHASAVAFNSSNFDEARGFINACVREAHRLGMFRAAARANSLLYLIAHHYCDYAECTWTLTQMKRDAERAGDSAALAFVKLNSYEMAVERDDTRQILEIEADIEHASSDAEVRTNETLAPALAMRAAWLSDFASAFELLDGSAERQSTTARRALRLAEVALYASAAGERDKAEASLKGLQDIFQSFPTAAVEFDTSRLVKSRILFAIAAILMGRASTAHNLLREVELGLSKYPPALRALVRAARAIYIHIETGAAHADMATALSELKQNNYGGYARLIEALPLPSSSSSPRFGALTKMELKILQALASGETSRRIAEQLGRSTLTVDSHVKSIIKKLGCSGRREAIALARRFGIV
jgi:ATP/maltotriose-dependent transcriptional regulator MalT